jgi:hypothetical protein
MWVCNRDGKNVQQLTFFEHPITLSGVESPDKWQIAFMSTKEGSFDICTINASAGFLKRLTTEATNDVGPFWSRDGHWVYFGTDRGGSHEIWKVPAEGGEPIQVTRNGGMIGFESEDGRSLYLTKQGARRGPPGVWRLPLDGGEESLVLDQVNYCDWTILGNSIVYLKRETEMESAVEIFDLSTGTVSRLGVLEQRPARWKIAASPGGKWALFSVLETPEADIMLVESFRHAKGMNPLDPQKISFNPNRITRSGECCMVLVICINDEVPAF